MFGFGAVFIFVNFLALRQSVTPAPHARTHDQHHALADPASGRSRRADRAAGWANTWACARLWLAGGTALRSPRSAWRLRVIRSVMTLPGLKAEALTPYSAERRDGAGLRGW